MIAVTSPWLFVQDPIQANNKENTKSRNTGFLYGDAFGDREDPLIKG